MSDEQNPPANPAADPSAISEKGRNAPLAPWQQLAVYYDQRRHLVMVWILGMAIVLFLMVLPPAQRTALFRAIESQRLLVALLLFFCLIMLSLLWTSGQSMDTWLFMYLNTRSRRSVWLDRLMFGITQLGSGIAAYTLAGIFYLRGFHRIAYEIFLGTMSLWLVVELVKAITRRARPFVHLKDVRIVGWRERGRSFPSGHTTQTFFLVAMLVYHLHLGTWGSLPLYSLGAIVGITRIYVGVHYPRDVMAGALLGTFWGILVLVLDSRLLG